MNNPQYLYIIHSLHFTNFNYSMSIHFFNFNNLARIKNKTFKMFEKI